LSLPQNRANRSARRHSKTRVALTHIVLIAMGILFTIPFLWMLSTALKPEPELQTSQIHWIPQAFLWENFHRATPQDTWLSFWSAQNDAWGHFHDAIMYQSKDLGFIPFLEYARNTVVLTILCVAGAVFSNSLVAYAFARLKWPGRDLFFAITLATMMVPFPVLMAPMFGLFKYLGWVGTFRPLWVPVFFGNAFNIFLLRRFFRTIPMELSEAAKIDGAGEFRIFLDVILPLAKPALGVVALFTFMATWNDFLGPLIYLSDPRTYTLALGLQAYQSVNGGTPWNLLMAATLMVVAPVIIVFFFAQKLFIQGIATSGLKG
jgi:multiple sugar transport system permease protein